MCSNPYPRRTHERDAVLWLQTQGGAECQRGETQIFSSSYSFLCYLHLMNFHLSSCRRHLVISYIDFLLFSLKLVFVQRDIKTPYSVFSCIS